MRHHSQRLYCRDQPSFDCRQRQGRTRCATRDTHQEQPHAIDVLVQRRAEALVMIRREYVVDLHVRETHILNLAWPGLGGLSESGGSSERAVHPTSGTVQARGAHTQYCSRSSSQPPSVNTPRKRIGRDACTCDRRTYSWCQPTVPFPVGCTTHRWGYAGQPGSMAVQPRHLLVAYHGS